MPPGQVESSTFYYYHSFPFKFTDNARRTIPKLYSTTSDPDIPACKFETPQYKGPSFETLTNIRKTRLTPNHVHYYKKPLAIHSGKMQWLYDDTGKRYLDMFAGIVTVSVGHCHP